MIEEFFISNRSEVLTSFFKIIPFFASDYFYISLIALLYWHNLQKKIYKDLGFLVAFSTFVTAILKNIMASPRPDQSQHLATVKDLYGFPSGDVLVAVVFWGILCKEERFNFLKIPAAILIWKSRGVQEITNAWEQGKTNSYWLLLFFSGLFCEFLHYKVAPSLLGLLSLGSLIGIGLALKFKTPRSKDLHLSIKSCLLSLLFLLAIIIVAKHFPLSHYNEIVFQLSIILKYAFICFAVYAIIPRIFIKLI